MTKIIIKNVGDEFECDFFVGGEFQYCNYRFEVISIREKSITLRELDEGVKFWTKIRSGRYPDERYIQFKFDGNKCCDTIQITNQKNEEIA